MSSRSDQSVIEQASQSETTLDRQTNLRQGLPYLIRGYLLPVLIFCGSLIAGSAITYRDVELRQTEELKLTEQILVAQVDALQRTLDHSLSSTLILAQAVIQSAARTDAFFDYAPAILRQYPGVYQLHIAPDGVVSDSYPRSRNNTWVGRQIVVAGDNAGRTESELSLTLNGPMTLANGQLGVIGTYPVLIPGRGAKRLWGYVSATILLESLLSEAGFAKLSDLDFDYQLAQLSDDTDGAEKARVFESAGAELGSDALSRQIQVPGSLWRLSIHRHNTSQINFRYLGYGFTFLIAAVLAFTARRILSEPIMLKHKVEQQTAKLYRLAYHDSLTGTPNRQSFYKILRRHDKSATQDKKRLALLLIDVDHFKEVNDSLGHDVGDRLLVEFVQRVTSILGNQGQLFRLGGDEFVILFDDVVSSEEPIAFCDTLYASLAEPFELDTQQLQVSCSVGVAVQTDSVQNTSDLLKYADVAMYEAKNAGRGGYCNFSDDLAERFNRQLRLTHDLKSAISNNELKLLYQPIYNSQTGKISKAEALIRWEHPILGTVNPLEFIPIAESSGCIYEIGDWIFHTALTQVECWQERYFSDFQISINVSPVQFRSEEQISDWINFLRRTGVKGRSILVEITEGVLLDNDSQTLEQLNRLRDMGVQFALDDFGTGYSSLAYLKYFPLDYLKIDKSFIKNLQKEQEDFYLCEAIIRIASKFGLKVVAEGVEIREQYNILTGLDCHFVQGYYFSRPVDAIELEEQFLSDPLFGYNRSDAA